jgi:hypothetical protein
MEDALTYAASGTFIAAMVALVRYLVRGEDGKSRIAGRFVPPIVLGMTIAWGVLLVVTGWYTGDAAEFVRDTVAVATGAVGLASVVSTFTPETSTVHRIT